MHNLAGEAVMVWWVLGAYVLMGLAVWLLVLESRGAHQDSWDEPSNLDRVGGYVRPERVEAQEREAA